MFVHMKMDWARAYGGWAVLALRVVTGVIFLAHGWQKFGWGTAQVAGFLGGLGFPSPEVFAVLLIAGELLAGIGLILGAWTRVAALLASFIAVVALITVHISKGFFMSGGGYEFILLILVSSLTFFTWGADDVSVDKKFLGM